MSAGDWYADAANWAVSRGIADSYDSGIFAPGEEATREETVVMLWRYAGEPASERELQFTDTAGIRAYALDAVRWAAERGIVSGNGNGAFVPKGPVTRAEAAQMLIRYFSA